MEALQQYGTAIISAALICAVVTRLSSSGVCNAIIKMLCGVFLTLVILRPLWDDGRLRLELSLDSWMRQAETISTEGAAIAGRMKRDIIKQELEAYISDKATEMHAQVEVRITVGEDMTPASVIIDGSFSPMAKKSLSKVLSNELGIPMERQEWIG